MDRFAEKQAQIGKRRDELIARYPALWANIIAEWKSPGLEDRAWLTYSANYLFRTIGIRWALAPLTLKRRLSAAQRVACETDLSRLAFVMLTHRHADHLDFNLLRALRDLPIQWIVPADILPQVMDQAELSPARVIVPQMLNPIRMQKLTVFPFEGLHWEMQNIAGEERLKGTPSVAYLVEFDDKRWLFPGDIRTYDASRVPSFGSVDGVFAHLWLGRGSALVEPPPWLVPFGSFYLALKPHRVVLAHLEEFGRDAAEYWNDDHALKVMSRWRELAPEVPISVAKMGERVAL